jgi:hypothetical protein
MACKSKSDLLWSFLSWSLECAGSFSRCTSDASVCQCLVIFSEMFFRDLYVCVRWLPHEREQNAPRFLWTLAHVGHVFGLYLSICGSRRKNRILDHGATDTHSGTCINVITHQTVPSSSLTPNILNSFNNHYVNRILLP